MASNPFEKYRQPAPAGDPVIAPADPYKQASEQRAREDQVLQREKLDREAAEWVATHNPDGTPKTDVGTPTEAQGKIATLLTRIAGGFNDIQATTANDASAQAPGLIESVRGNLMPGGLGGLVTREIAGSDRRTVHDSQRDVLDALLTLGTGAAYTPEQLTTNMAAYFPQYGDTEAEIAVKNNRMVRLIEAAKKNAGPAWAQVEPAIEPYMKSMLQTELQQTMAAQGGEGPTDQGAIGYTPEGLQVRVTDDSPAPPAGGGGSEFWQQIGLGTGDAVEGVGDIVGMVANPLNAGVNAALGTNLSTDMGQNLRDMSGLPQSSDNIYSTVNKFGAGALAGGGLARTMGQVMTPGVWQAVAQTLGRTPIRDTVAGAGAGAGSYVGRESGIPGGEYAGALLGGFAGYGASGVGMNALMPRAPSPMAQAATRQGVDMLPADVGGRATQMVTSGAKASPISAGPVVRQAQENTSQLANAARRTAEGQGDIVTTDVAGQNIRRGAENYAKQSRDRWGRLYERAYDEAGDTKIVPAKTLAAIDERIARLKNDPSAPPSAIDEMQRFRDNIANGVNILGLRDARTRLSEGTYDGKLRSNVDQAAWKEILGNLSDDIGEGLTAAGKSRAAAMFKRADEGWRSRVEHIDEVLQPIIGRDGMKSGEDVLKAVETMARGGSGGNARLSRLLGNMAPEEAGQVRAVIIDRLGKATPGAQDAAGEVFSPSTFLTNWNKMTPQAKASLFSDTQLRKDLNDIATLADGMKATRSLENFSNTALSIGSNVGAGVMIGSASPTALVLGAGAQYLTGRLMASPGFARLLASSAKSKAPPEIANRRFTEQLGVLASKEPLIAADARQLQQFLNDAVMQSPGRAAAEDEGNGGQPVPQQ